MNKRQLLNRKLNPTAVGDSAPARRLAAESARRATLLAVYLCASATSAKGLLAYANRVECPARMYHSLGQMSPI